MTNIDITKQDYQDLPCGWCASSHKSIKDIVETSPMSLMNLQLDVINDTLNLVTDDPEEDENIACIETEDFIEYWYGSEKLLSMDTQSYESDGTITFNYNIYRIDYDKQ